MTEVEEKESRVRALLEERGLDALWLRRSSSFAWATGGAPSYINTATDTGVASLLYAPTGRYVVTTNIEAPRFEREEGLGAQGWEIVGEPWPEEGAAIGRLTEGLRLGVDGAYPGAEDLSAEVGKLRAHLTPDEGERFRELGRLCAEAMDTAIRRVRPGQTEHEIAALLAGESEARGAWPVVDLVATDERIFEYRHPLPTEKRLERYAMLVLCGRKWGLVCSMTRLVYFGQLPDELRRKQEALLRVDAAYIAATRPGAKLRDVFERGAREYAATGFPDEWRLHHQGGSAGYEGREEFATPASTSSVAEGMAFAWNPSITGTKSEDTILVGGEGNEVLTEIPGWPAVEVEMDGRSFKRPVILEA